MRQLEKRSHLLVHSLNAWDSNQHSQDALGWGGYILMGCCGIQSRRSKLIVLCPSICSTNVREEKCPVSTRMTWDGSFCGRNVVIGQVCVSATRVASFHLS